MSFREYAKLSHFQTASQLIAIPILGALATGLRIDIFDILVLGVIGFLVNMFGFTMNEYIDVEVDTASKELSDKPLVKGTIPREHALVMAFGSLSLTFVLAGLYFPDLVALTMLTISIAFAGIYNLIGKQYAGVDFLLGVWAFFFCLFGAYAFTSEAGLFVYIIATLILFQWWFANIVEGGVKDAEHDFDIGVRNTTTAWGVRVMGDKLAMPRSYQAFGFILTLWYIIIVAIPYLFLGLQFQIWQYILLLILCTTLVYSGMGIISMTKFDRVGILKFIIISEFSKAFIPPIILVSIIGYYALLLVGFIFLWAVVFMLYEYGTAPPAI